MSNGSCLVSRLQTAHFFLFILFLFSLVTGCCYRLLENPTISHQKNRSTKEAIAHLLGVALVRYNHMLSELPSTSLARFRPLLCSSP